jgi:hypothetical protein
MNQRFFPGVYSMYVIGAFHDESPTSLLFRSAHVSHADKFRASTSYRTCVGCSIRYLLHLATSSRQLEMVDISLRTRIIYHMACLQTCKLENYVQSREGSSCSRKPHAPRRTEKKPSASRGYPISNNNPNSLLLYMKVQSGGRSLVYVMYVSYLYLIAYLRSREWTHSSH